ncbi:MAG: hypothetical protein IT287_05975 [Bdellovibrionaceae bacterium]|nr:hypothetical protein [Pseudobdellovibrionaceae bacterium]
MFSSSKSTLGRNLVLVALMPFVFACSKSKFSAVKNNPAPVQQTNQPAPVVQNPQPTYPIDNGCTNGNCNPPPTYTPPPITEQPPCDPPPVYNPPPVVEEPPVYNPPPVVEKPPVYNPPPVVTQPPQNCQDYEYEVPDYKGPRAMNVWVVMDGSKSNAKERYSQLVSLVTMYEQNLARSMPLTISLIAGHSPESSDSVLGGKSLFYRHDSEPAVLKFYAGMSESARQCALASLERKVLQMRTDNSRGISDGGELLTANLLAALKPSNRSRAEQAGAYGRGNILNIHFIGDENDICTKGQVPDANKIKNPETGKMTTAEDYAHYKHCGMMDVNSQGYSQTLFNELSALNSSGEAKVHVTGFIYTGENAVPRDGENEVGHGMLELIQATGGRAYDLAALTNQDAYNKASLALAGHINKEGNLYVRYQIKKEGQVVGLSNIDRKKTVVMVDGQKTSYRTDSNGNYIYLVGCPVDAKKVKIKYCNQK